MIIVGDLHLDARLGNIRTRDLIEEKKEKLLELINAEDMVVFLGDYFNVPEPSNEFRHFFSDMLQDIKVPKRLLLGNHDIDNQNQQNCLSAISPYLTKEEIVNEYCEMGNTCLVSYLFDYDKLQKVISETKCKYIIGHFSFDYESHGRLLEGEVRYKPEYDGKVFILGHIHKYQVAKPNVIYLGSFAPHKLDELEFDYKIGYLKGGEFTTKNVKHNIKQKVIRRIEDLEGVDERTKVVFELEEGVDKEIIMKKLKEKKMLSYQIKEGSKEIDTQNLNLSGLLTEYLKVIGRPDLYDKVMGFIETENVENLLKVTE
jgi:DNA repair exonuclease SbcCD nuclease subunit